MHAIVYIDRQHALVYAIDSTFFTLLDWSQFLSELMEELVSYKYSSSFSCWLILYLTVLFGNWNLEWIHIQTNIQ